MYRKFAFISIPLLMLMAACVKPYYPEIDKYDKILVIDGMLTDDGDAPLVAISQSYKIEAKKTDAINDAIVYIVDSDANRYYLTEVKSGIYSYVEPMFPVKQGLKYQLVVEYENKIYSSTKDVLLPVAPISDITINPVITGENQGVSIKMSSIGNDSMSRYYAWAYEETWKFQVPVYANKFNSKQICYNRTKSSGISVGTTESYVNNQFDLHDLYNVSNKTQQLSIRYSTLVKQYSITRETYLYLKFIQNQNENTGSLFDPLPASLSGNITCTSDMNEAVIGNFQLSSVSSKRIFIDRQDLPSDLAISDGSENCQVQMVEFSKKRNIDSLLQERYLILDTVTSGLLTYLRFCPSSICFDCTATGAPNTPPSWWEEKK